MFDIQSLRLCIDSVVAILSMVCPRSLLGLTTLIAAFLNSSKRGPMNGIVASLWGTPSQGSPMT